MDNKGNFGNKVYQYFKTVNDDLASYTFTILSRTSLLLYTTLHYTRSHHILKCEREIASTT